MPAVTVLRQEWLEFIQPGIYLMGLLGKKIGQQALPLSWYERVMYTTYR